MALELIIAMSRIYKYKWERTQAFAHILNQKFNAAALRNSPHFATDLTMKGWSKLLSAITSSRMSWKWVGKNQTYSNVTWFPSRTT
jgi:hypothetical protein